MTQNLRQQIADSLVDTLRGMRDPRLVLVTVEPFEVAELAITQFPAILITATEETRSTVSMGGSGVGRRSGEITYTIRGFVRGTELDRKRNDLIERIEEVLDGDQFRTVKLDGLATKGVYNSEITAITVVERQPPLAEIAIDYVVRYNYLRAQT